MSKAPAVKKTKQSKQVMDMERHKKLDDGPSTSKMMKFEKLESRKNNFQLDLEEDSALPRDISLDDEASDAMGLNFNAMFSGLGAGMSKTVAAKTKLAEQFSGDIVKSSMDFIDNVVTAQQTKREEFQKQFTNDLKQLIKRKRTELDVARDNEDKLIRTLQHHMKYSQQKLVTLTKLDNDISELSSTYLKTVEQLDSAQAKELEQAKAETKEKLITSKKKFCKDLSGLEVSVMKKSLLQFLK